MSRPQIVCFGDSIVQFGFKEKGWCQQLQNWYEIKADVLNRGLSGYNSTLSLKLVDEIFEKLNPDLILVLFGSNDCSLGIQGVKLEDYYSNMKEIILKLKKLHPKSNIALISPPPLIDSKERKNDTLEKYLKVLTKISEEENVPLLETWVSMQMQIKWEDFVLKDGLHLSDSGNEFLFLEVSNFIVENFPKLDPEMMKYPFKHWKEAFGILEEKIEVKEEISESFDKFIEKF